MHTITTLSSTLLLDTKSILGEGPVWNHHQQKLFWIEIEEGVLHSLSIDGAKHEQEALGQKVGAIVPAVDGSLLLALKDGLYVHHKGSATVLLKTNPENNTTGNRFNDGKCDPSGRFWIGTIGDAKTAALYRLDAEGKLDKMETGITTSNGLAWSLDGQTMYYIDTDTRTVVAYGYNAEDGSISGPRVVIHVPAEMGYPDGCTIDAEGMLWIALWGGYAVGQWNPLTGALLSKIEVPSSQVTSCTFGGEAMDTLYITSARRGLSEEELSKYPHSGSLFECKPGVKGLKADFYKLNK